jgi:hypothetical protein
VGQSVVEAGQAMLPLLAMTKGAKKSARFFISQEVMMRSSHTA